MYTYLFFRRIFTNYLNCSVYLLMKINPVVKKVMAKATKKFVAILITA